MTSSGEWNAQGYVGLAGGPTKISDSCEGTTSCDTTGTGFKVYGGYRFAPNLAGEVVVMRFGKATATGNVGGSSMSVEPEPTAVGAGVACLGEFSPGVAWAARIGAARVKVSANGSGRGITTSDSESSTQAYFGLAVGYAFSSAVSLDAAYDFSRGKFGGGTDNLSLFSVGVRFTF